MLLLLCAACGNVPHLRPCVSLASATASSVNKTQGCVAVTGMPPLGVFVATVSTQIPLHLLLLFLKHVLVWTVCFSSLFSLFLFDFKGFLCGCALVYVGYILLVFLSTLKQKEPSILHLSKPLLCSSHSHISRISEKADRKVLDSLAAYLNIHNLSST